ncbi:DNA-binding protein [Candidatus Woesearchaeota archaeon CG10_big_fil_rev_8_21_14_0_10_45_16]|nr:MAG: DNA-binding protein [Candidatus Woesearchaeota archaeon CG10_big_fil_rev_8_21_14_0_10_45_16]
MKTILVDTNALMAIGEFGVDIFSELDRCSDFPYKVAILEGTISELEKISQEQRGKYKLAAKLALSIIKSKNVKVIKSLGNVDDLLTAYSRKGYLILTQDMALKRRLQKPYLTIRQKKKVVMVG